MNCRQCGDCALSASFVKECSDVSYVAGERVELTVHKETVVLEEINRGTQREHSSKPLKHSFVKRILVFKR